MTQFHRFCVWPQTHYGCRSKHITINALHRCSWQHCCVDTTDTQWTRIGSTSLRLRLRAVRLVCLLVQRIMRRNARRDAPKPPVRRILKHLAIKSARTLPTRFGTLLIGSAMRRRRPTLCRINFTLYCEQSESDAATASARQAATPLDRRE